MRAIKLISVPFALAFLLSAALLAPAAAQAKTPSATLTLKSEVFPSHAALTGGMSGTIPGTPLTGGMSGTIPVSGGSSVSVTAPAYVYVPPPTTAPSGTAGTIYQFEFWNANGTLKTKAKATFTAPSTGAFQATAWYIPTGGGTCGTPTTPPCPAPQVTTSAFSLTKNAFLPGTPIMAATSGWTSPSTTVFTAQDVTITAFDFLGAHTKYNFTLFRSWFAFGGSGITASGRNLAVPAGESPWAIAFYKQVTASPPPPPPPV